MWLKVPKPLSSNLGYRRQKIASALYSSHNVRREWFRASVAANVG